HQRRQHDETGKLHGRRQFLRHRILRRRRRPSRRQESRVRAGGIEILLARISDRRSLSGTSVPRDIQREAGITAGDSCSLHPPGGRDIGERKRRRPLDGYARPCWDGVSLMNTTSLSDIPLPAAIRSRFVDDINGLRMHVLEAGFETRGRPCVLLLHGFPELAYSWRKVMPALADAGYHVIAPDQRGYGRTTGWDASFDGDLHSFRLTNLVRDALGLVSAFGHASVDVVIGHDFGSPVAAWCALVRPDVFRSVVMMSAPFGGPPSLPFDTADAAAKPG